jgi:hypothetical protein
MFYRSHGKIIATQTYSQETRMKAGGIHAGFFLALFLDPEDGGDMFLRNVG